jgi:hypothetical protein
MDEIHRQSSAHECHGNNRNKHGGNSEYEAFHGVHLPQIESGQLSIVVD